MLGREAFVAEVAVDLIDALEAADDQSLEVELGGDPQIERAIQRVVVGQEGPRRRAAVERLQDRRLDLDKSLPVEIGADRRDDSGSVDEQLARVLARDQVQLAPTVAGLDVAQPVMLVGRRAQRLGEDLKAIDAQRQLATAAAQHRAVDADQVPKVERAQPREGVLAEHVHTRVQLDLAGPVDEIEERSLAGAPPRGDPTRNPVGVFGLLARGQVDVGVENRRDRLYAGERVGESLGVGLLQPVRLRAPLGDQLRQAVPCAVRLGIVGAAHRGEVT